jgi:cytochrome c-type biogenesis protein CcmE
MKKILPIFFLLFTAIGVLVYVGVVYASVPVMKIAELRNITLPEDNEVRVDEGKVASVESYAPLRFTVAAAKDPSSTLVVESRRTVPENFKVGIEVSVVGEYDASRHVLTAYRVSTMCPTKYEASKEGTANGEPAYRSPPGAAPGYALPSAAVPVSRPGN